MVQPKVLGSTCHSPTYSLHQLSGDRHHWQSVEDSLEIAVDTQVTKQPTRQQRFQGKSRVFTFFGLVTKGHCSDHNGWVRIGWVPEGHWECSRCVVWALPATGNTRDEQPPPSPPPLARPQPRNRRGGWDRLQSRDLSSDEGGLTIF